MVLIIKCPLLLEQLLYKGQQRVLSALIICPVKAELRMKATPLLAYVLKLLAHVGLRGLNRTTEISITAK